MSTRPHWFRTRALALCIRSLALCMCSLATPALRAQEVPSLLGLTADGQVWRIDSALGRGVQTAYAPAGWDYTAVGTQANGIAWAARRQLIIRGHQPPIEIHPELIRLGPDGNNEPRWRLAEGELPHGLAFDRYGLCLGIVPSQPPVLVHYDFEHALVVTLGPLALSTAADLTWSEGRWLVWSNDAGLSELDPWTRTLTPIGTPPEPNSTDFHFLCEVPGGRLVAGYGELWHVDPFQGTASLQATGSWPPLCGADRWGPHCWYPYGTGCAGSGSFVPELGMLGCAGGGGSISLALRGGLGGSPALILLGAGEEQTLLPNGCWYYFQHLLDVHFAAILSGENPGEGELTLHIPLAHGTRGFCNAQGFILDPLVPGGFTSTNAISLRVPF